MSDNSEQSSDQTEAKNKLQVNMKTPVAPAIEEIYVDGVSGIMARGGIFKLDCYRVEGVAKDGKTETRRISHRLVLPATGIGELVKVVENVLKSVQQAKEQFENKHNQVS